MQIVLNTDSLSELDRTVLQSLLSSAAFVDPAPAPKAAEEPTAVKTTVRKAAAPKAAPAPKLAPVPDPEPESEADTPADEDFLGTETASTMDDAVRRASQLASSGRVAEVRAVLTEMGLKRVSELKTDALLTRFMAALPE